MSTSFIRLHPSDDVVIARSQLMSGSAVEGVPVRGLIPPGHKIATRAIAVGEPVRRYNQIIGFAHQPIAPGEHVHTQNLNMGAEKGNFERDYAIGQDVKPEPARKQATFMGYQRSDGRVATRNYDGVVALTHGTGCGMDTEGMGMQLLERTLAGYATHANFWGVVVVGLGCESNQLGTWLAHSSLRVGDTLKVFNIQDTGGTRLTVEKGIALIEEMLPRANATQREPCSAEHITVGLQCGGSDGYSGISANPALGAAVDLLVQHGGTAILSETPEIYGAEHLLTRRAVKPEVAHKLIERIKWWENYTAINGGEMNNNPSPGNKAGGLTTILEKSLGAVAKGGTSNLQAVYEYAEPVTAKGFVYMDTPGYDPVSATGQVAGGANLICFTTGRGSAYGCAPSPSLKFSTNTALWKKQEEDMDLNCGEIVDGGVSIAEMGQRIFEMILAAASGEPTKSERHGYGQNEFVPWQVGAVM
jgi:altronate hydrolase